MCHSPGSVLRFTRIHGMYFGAFGLRRSGMFASSGVRLFLRLLQRMHAQTRFSHVDGPRLLLGWMWSTVISRSPRRPQYWHV